MLPLIQAGRSRPCGTATNTAARLIHRSARNVQSAAIPTAAPEADYEPRQMHPAVKEILARRVKAGKLVAGTAAYSDSDMFKPSVRLPLARRKITVGEIRSNRKDQKQEGKPKARRWDDHLTRESRERRPCTLKQAARHLKKPGLISLGGGLPSSEHFPFAELGIKIPEAPWFSDAGMQEHGRTVTIGKYDVRNRDSTYDLSIALNYSQASGSAQMLRFITEHTEIVCRPPYADWRVCQTIGSTGALEQVLRMLCDRDRGDSVLTESFSFSTALETLSPLGIQAFGCAMDDQGMIPEAMDELLSRWDEEERGTRKPHVFYTVPSGHNPTGATPGLERKRRIYRVARKHNLLIIEDDPYYFLQMQPYTSREEPAAPLPSDSKEFLASLVPTFVSLDTDGRVIRLDTFSKVLAPGSRLGWIVASEQIVERFQRHGEVATQGPAGFSQVILHKLLDETWGHEGYLKWLMSLRLEYTKKRDACLAACEDHLPRDLVSWAPPAAGMFVG